VLLVAGGGRDVLNDVAGNDLLIGGTGADTLNGGAGNDILVGGVGSTYIYDAGYGSDIIVNGTTNDAAATWELDFGAGVAADELWFSRSGNVLAIDIVGPHSTITVAGWFSGASHQLTEIKAGGLELDGKVAQLVQAMASYGAANPGFDPSAVAQAPADAHLQATIAAAWHAA
jgi:serralysin